MERTIWTPHFCSEKDFKVYLDSGFAKEVMQSKIPNEMQKGMNELGNEELKRLGVNWLNPYEFYEDSCFVTQFNIGQNGVWLAVNHQTIDSLLEGSGSSKIIEYDSHNVDYSRDAYVLLVLFGKWVEYTDVLRDI